MVLRGTLPVGSDPCRPQKGGQTDTVMAMVMMLEIYIVDISISLQAVRLTPVMIYLEVREKRAVRMERLESR